MFRMCGAEEMQFEAGSQEAFLENAALLLCSFGFHLTKRKWKKNHCAENSVLRVCHNYYMSHP